MHFNVKIKCPINIYYAALPANHFLPANSIACPQIGSPARKFIPALHVEFHKEVAADGTLTTPATYSPV